MPEKPQIISRQRQISEVRASTWDAKAGTFEAVIASERPAPMWDWETGETVDEILLASGMKMPGRLKQVPLQDSHSRRSILDTLGSVRNIRADNDVVIGEAHLNLDTQRGKAAAVLVSAGDLTDLSVGYEFADKDVLRLKAGETRLVSGREFSGPANIVKRWTLKEVSLVAIGADVDAKIRSEPQDSEGSNAPDASHPGNDTPALGEGGLMEERTMEPDPKTPASPEAGGAPPVPQKAAEPDLERIKAEARAEGERAERERCAAIREFGAIAGTPTEKIESLISEKKTQAEARAAILADKKERDKIPSGTPHVEVTRDARECFRKRAVDSILVRGGVIALDKAEKGTNELLGFRLQDLMRASLEVRGFNTRMVDFEGMKRLHTRTGSGADAQGTDAFPNILLDARNKSVGIGFAEAPTTYNTWCRVQSANDLRPHYIAKLSGFPSLPKVNEHGEVPFKEFSDKKESFTPYEFAARSAITDAAVINDDLSVLTARPRAMGEAAARTVEEYVWWTVLTNPTMSEDSVSLFDTSTHGNLAGSGAVVSETTLNAARLYFRTVKQLNQKPLNLRPAYLLAPPAIESTVWKWLNDEVIPGGNNNERNPFTNWVTPIISPYLSDGVTMENIGSPASGSATAWYLATSPGVMETIIVAFVGSQTPTFDQERPLDYLGTEDRVVLRFGVGVGDWRGFYKNPGA